MTIQELIKHLQSLPQDIPVYLRKDNTPEVFELKFGPEVNNFHTSEDGTYISIEYNDFVPRGWTRHQGIVF